MPSSCPIGAAVAACTTPRRRRPLPQTFGPIIGHSLHGVTVVVDCANGAASTLGPQVYADAGAKVIAIHSDPDGVNINDGCGSTHLDKLQAAVLEYGADLGLAMMVTPTGAWPSTRRAPWWTAT